MAKITKERVLPTPPTPQGSILYSIKYLQYKTTISKGATYAGKMF